MPISKALKNLGVKEADTAVYPRLIMAVTAHDQRGKTHFALTAPSPSLIISSDIGTEGVVGKFQAEGKEIYEHQWTLPEAQKDAKKEWESLAAVFEAALQDEHLRTIILDTESEVWQLLRLFKFGKLEKIPSYMYGEVNAIASRMYKRAFQHKKNVILLRKFKAKYINDKRTADYEPSGFGDIHYIAQVTATAGREKRSKNNSNSDFNMTITKCRHNPELEGEIYTGPMCCFPYIASEVVTTIPMSEWS